MEARVYGDGARGVQGRGAEWAGEGGGPGARGGALSGLHCQQNERRKTDHRSDRDQQYLRGGGTDRERSGTSVNDPTVIPRGAR